MDAKKDISDMSFEEFFSESKVKKEKESERVAAARAKKEEAHGNGPAGFQGSGPKLNFTNGRIMVYIPRYTSSENSRFEAAVISGDDHITLGRIDSIKQRSSRVTRPKTLDITGAGVLPFGGFTITIDGAVVFEQKPSRLLFFNNMGNVMRKPFGEVYAVCEPGTRLKLSRATVKDVSEKNGLGITHLDVQATGGIWVDDSDPSEETEEEVPEDVPAEPEAPAKKPAPKKAPAKKVKGSVTLPAGLQDADIVVGKEVLALYDSIPEMTVSVEGCELSECEISMEQSGTTIVKTEAVARATFKHKDLWGPVEFVVSKGGKALDRKKVFILPGFSCSYAGKGDITQDTSISYAVLGEKGTCDASDGDKAFEHEGVAFAVRWAVPAVTYDVGQGPVKLSDDTITAADIKDGRMTIVAKGARKKAVFFGGETGKKRELVSNWDGDSVTIDMGPVIDEIYSNTGATHCLYITVNSFPNRRFLTIGSPERITASYSDGNIHVETDPAMGECVCRLYKIDRSQEDIAVQPGSSEIPVAADVIEAEVMEMHEGRARVTVTVQIIRLPFVLEDDSGDVWLYVSKSKRIPLPDNLFADGRPDDKIVKSWYERIVRMNPELRSIALPAVLAAFQDFSQRIGSSPMRYIKYNVGLATKTLMVPIKGIAFTFATKTKENEVKNWEMVYTPQGK